MTHVWVRLTRQVVEHWDLSRDRNPFDTVSGQISGQPNQELGQSDPGVLRMLIPLMCRSSPSV